MIQAKDLRLGNKVLVDGQICTVNNLFPNNVRVAERSIYDQIEHESNYDPIPLSPGILLRCGFKKAKHDNETFAVKGPNGKLAIVLHYSKDFYYMNEPEAQHFKYLHQLQNLFFALTGEELEVNLISDKHFLITNKTIKNK